MIEAIKNIYVSEDLNGEAFLKPLKEYHGFFAKKIEDSSGVKKMAWVVVNIATGILLYPAFGLLAGGGILIKLTGISRLKKHNDAEKLSVEAIRVGISHSGAFLDNSSYSVIQCGWRMGVAREFIVTKQNVDEQCSNVKKEIDAFTAMFRKIYVASSGFIYSQYDPVNDSYANQGSMTIQLRIRERL